MRHQHIAKYSALFGLKHLFSHVQGLANFTFPRVKCCIAWSANCAV